MATKKASPILFKVSNLTSNLSSGSCTVSFAGSKLNKLVNCCLKGVLLQAILEFQSSVERCGGIPRKLLNHRRGR